MFRVTTEEQATSVGPRALCICGRHQRVIGVAEVGREYIIYDKLLDNIKSKTTLAHFLCDQYIRGV